MATHAITNDQVKMLYALSKEVLKDNVFSDGTDSGYTAASGKIKIPETEEIRFLYPFQWLWDTFFIAAWNEDTEQSKKDITKYLNSQSDDGFLGHIRYNRDVLAKNQYFPPPDIYYKDGKLPQRGEITSKITQPPICGYGLNELVKKLNKSKENDYFSRESYQKILKYHEYLYENMCTEDGLLITLHPWQAGDDNSPKWDAIYKNLRNSEEFHSFVNGWLKKLGVKYERMDIKLIAPSQRPVDSHYDVYLYLIYLYTNRNWDNKYLVKESPFRIADPMMNSILIRSNNALIELANMFGYEEDRKIIESWNKRTLVGLDRLWENNKGIYFSRDLTNNELIKIETVSGLMPLFSTKIDIGKAAILADKIQKILFDPVCIFSIPSTFSWETDYFEPLRYWRGPVWIIINTLLSDGLGFYGYNDMEMRINNDSLRLVYNSLNDRKGFFEYFSPITGKGLGSPLQSWTAAAIQKISRDFMEADSHKLAENKVYNIINE